MKRIKFLLIGALLPMGAFASDVYFQSPTGNIYCEGQGDSVGCMIFDTQKGHDGCAYTISADDKKARKQCAADGSNVDDDDVKTLAYGKSIKGNGWQCTSAKTGMTCKNSQGHGFTLSRAKQKLF